MNYIAVCTPARDMVHTMYSYDLVNMVAYHTLNTNDAVSLKISQGTLIANQRAELSLDAMREDCSHILFIDSDMRFPQDMIGRLLKHDLDIVATNCARRRMPTGPTAQLYKENGERELVWTMPESTGLQEVGSVGMGVMLIKANVLQRWPSLGLKHLGDMTKEGTLVRMFIFAKKQRLLALKYGLTTMSPKRLDTLGLLNSSTTTPG